MKPFEKQINDWTFHAHMNICYYQGRERWYGGWINWTGCLTIAFTSAAAAQVIGDFLPHSQMLVAALTLITAILNSVVFGFSMLNQYHESTGLKKRWVEFLATVECLSNDDDLRPVVKQFHDLNRLEPAPDEDALDKAYSKTVKALGWEVPKSV